MTEFLLFLYAESPVHPGAANSDGVLDLPVQREAATGYPVIWGQSLKGALRQAARETWRNGQVGWVKRVFGSDVDDRGEDGSTPGLLNVGDAQLAAMPVPTLRRTFAWITSQIALARLARKYAVLADQARPPLEVPAVADDAAQAVGAVWAQAADEVLGPCVIPVSPAGPVLAAWAERLARDAIGTGTGLKPFADKLTTDLILVGADIAPTLLRECTQQSVRVQLGEDRKVRNGPFYCEYLPAETIMVASLTLRGDADIVQIRQALTELLDDRLIQVGGDETIGKGLVWTRLVSGSPV